MTEPRKLKDAPRDGTPFLLVNKENIHVIRYLDFVNGYDKVEKCDGAFYPADDDRDFLFTMAGNENLQWMPLTGKQIAAIMKVIE